MRLVKGIIYTDKMCFKPVGITIEEDRIEKIERYEAGELTGEQAETYILL